MPAFDPALVRFTILLLLAALYLPVIVYAIRNREGQESAVWLVVFYSLLGLSLGVGEAYWHEGVIGDAASQFLNDTEIYGAFALAIMAMFVIQTFLRKSSWWVWFGFASLWALVLTLFLSNAFNLPDPVWTNGTLLLPRARLAPGWAVLGWLILIISAIITVANAARHARQPLYRNRLNYWTPTFLLMLANDIMLFAGVEIAGNPLRLGIALLMAYIVCTHDMPDMRQILRRAVVYVITTILIVGLYAAGFTALESAFGSQQNFNPLVLGAIVSLILALIFTPLVSGVRRLVGVWMKVDQYNPSRTLHEYSQSVSNILDMDRLASVAVGITLEIMQIERGFLFLVDSDREASGQKKYRLRSARSPEERQMIAIELDDDSPIVSYFIREQRPLLQYDLDLLPIYRSASPVERDWFDNLQSEVYVPIFAKRQWIGLLAFGSKLSGNRYTDEDLVTLSALANQTAVALENARLVDNLMRLNTELRTARRALEKNNRDLERIDQAKSDFISIASHELRTPLTVIKGYTEMILEDSNLDPNLKMVMKGIHDGTNRLHEVMDSMFDIAQIDARSLMPHLQSVDLSVLILEVCNSLEKMIKERRQLLTIELPMLPLVKSDPNLLRKLFHHLTNNAIKFTPNNGRIRISGRSIPPVIDLPEGAVEIIVSDTGVGVDPNFREIIFTKFYQPGDLGKHSTSKMRFKGSGAGLGLALSKGIVEAHGGRIWVESPGYDEIHFPGSEFHVLLPLTKPAEDESIKVSEPVKSQI
ncbi:MAG: GAF domain-containing sensor histidine kinase [Chloroflexi bacterium]|nr:GAF domain-containing sensor histidine kinase [Chloroflexota bacterium]